MTRQEKNKKIIELALTKGIFATVDWADVIAHYIINLPNSTQEIVTCNCTIIGKEIMDIQHTEEDAIPYDYELDNIIKSLESQKVYYTDERLE